MTLDDLESLDEANKPWLPKVRQMISVFARDAICQAVKGAETKEEALYRIAWIRCLLLHRKYCPQFEFYNLNSLMTVADCALVMNGMVDAIRPLSDGSVVHAISVRGNAVHSCLMAEESGRLSGEEAVVYVVFCTNRPWLAVHSMGSKVKSEVDAYLRPFIDYTAELFQKETQKNVRPASQAATSCPFPSTQGYCDVRPAPQVQPPAHTSSAGNVEQNTSSLSVRGKLFLNI
ncbi:hypothetical protein V5799_025731 [Amblyomma americanum]|uniref:Uncharacterized protein n=1 Tax=Amblyomma americanum TaxID=6943 RepID=A0AAQ4E8M1_AMBAM